MDDPNATLQALRDAIKETYDGTRSDKFAAFERAAELAERLDDWLTSGGVLPDAWQPKLNSDRVPAWRVMAQVGHETTDERGEKWRGERQVTMFVLPSTLGLRDKETARKVAQRIIDPFGLLAAHHISVDTDDVKL